MPIYPSLSVWGQVSDTRAEDYDPSSIIFSYIDTGNLSQSYMSDTGLIRVDMDTVSGSMIANTEPLEDAKLSDAPPPASTVKMYTVVEYDDIMKIATKHNVDYEVILWMNDIALSDTLKVGQQIRIPALSGVIHTLLSGETISGIAKMYGVSSESIMTANSITDPTRIRDGRKLLVPGATRPTPPPPAPKPKVEPKAVATTKTPASTPAPQVSAPAEQPVSVEVNQSQPSEAIVSAAAAANLKDRYLIKNTGNGRGFVPGNCTWFVAQNKTVTWRGNANQWMKNAKAQ